MTGGVSLAVWIGGAAHELNRLVRRGEGVYANLLDMTGTTPRVDVIAGTSAGGINGALLATAQVHESNLDGARQLWLERGELERILRPPSEKDPPSLMKGDEYLLAGIREALASLVNRPPDRLPPVERVPVHLLITSTLLGGLHRGIPDSYGSVIPDLDHHGEFTFRRGRGQSHHPDECIHPKGRMDGDDWAEPGTMDRIALAARSTASFPFAFEPSFCPVGSTPDDLHPDMACHASFDISRWAIDGGVLVNRPLEPALRAIFAQEATRQVRRVLAYLVPDPGVEQKDLPDDQETPPTLAQVAYASLVSLPRNQSVYAQLDRIKDHNARVAAQRRRRQAAVEARLELLPLAAGLYGRYRRVRGEQLADWFVELVAHGAAIAEDPDSRGGVPLWDRSALRGEFEARLRDMHPASLPQVEAPITGWFITLGTLDRAGALGVDLLGRSLRLTNPRAPETSAADRRRIRDLRQEVHDALRAGRQKLPRLTPREHRRLAEEALEALRANQLATRADSLIERVLGTPGLLWPELLRIASAVRLGAPVVLRLCDQAAESAIGRPAPWEAIEEAKALARTFAGDGTESTEAAVLWRMLALEVVEVALADQPPIVEQSVEVLHLSADASNGFDPRARPDQKLAGLQLAHFGAFYKRSWRANDWMWGRLDGAQRLTQVLLDPPRLRQLGYSVDDALTAIEETAFEGLGDEDRRTLETAQPRAWNREVAQSELAFLDEPERPLPATLPICAQALSRRVQLGILRDELGWVAGAVDYDAEVGGKSPGAQVFSGQVRDAGPDPSAAEVVRLFQSCKLGQERLEYDGSPLLARTASRTVAVLTSAISGTYSGLGDKLLQVRRGVRGIGLVLYLLVRNAMAGSRIGAIATIAALAAAGALVAAGILAGAGALVTLGGALLLAGLGVATLRLRWKWGLLTLVLTAAIAAAPRLAFELADWPSEDFMDWFETPWVIFCLVVGAIVLGNLGVVWPAEQGDGGEDGGGGEPPKDPASPA